MDEHCMKKYQHLLQNIWSKAAVCAVFVAVFMAAPASLFAQSAEVKNLGVFYKNTKTDDSDKGFKEMYCDFSGGTVTSFTTLKTGGPFYLWYPVSYGATIEDGTLVWQITDTTGYATLAACGLEERQHYTQMELGDERCIISTLALITNVYVRAKVVRARTYSSSATYSFTPEENKSFTQFPSPDGNTNVDPYVSSALIEYDQPFPDTIPTNNSYPNHCLALCMDVVCTNYPLGASTYSIAFPIQDVSFDIVRYYNNKNISNADEATPVRTIDIYPQFSNAGTHGDQDYVQLPNIRCGSYRCSNSDAGASGGTSFSDCIGAKYACTDATNCWDISTGKTIAPTNCKWGGTSGHTDCIIFNNDGVESGVPMKFCTAWDGSYEHEGELGKSNGLFGFRGHIATKFPGDQMAVDSIEFDTSAAYPGMNQIPIQVDVTNVHTVRSTPSLVGKITSVPAQPYTFVYRLSKDADVRIVLLDASSDDTNYYTGTQFAYTDNTSTEHSEAENKIVRHLVDWQPRNGEGIKGQDKDTYLNAFDNWDGRNDLGMLLPAGNYIASIQAKSQDEWPGIDFSRAVTRQVSLDPLVLTDVQVTGLNKKATAYATISYIPTESATVYWEIYTPNTVFESILTDSSAPTGTKPTIKSNTGSLVYSSQEQKSSRMSYISRWDGTCQVEGGCKRYYAKGEKKSNGDVCTDTTCTETFAKGSPMPDGNYVSVLWAEIPYNGCYKNVMGNGGTPSGTPVFTAGAACDAGNDGKQFTGVKTLKYTVGTLEVERGLVGITIQPVSYSTIGSTPTAYGLDPFIFQYALDRDADVVASVQNTAGIPVRYLTPKTGTANVAQQLNRLSWDGRDEQGRMVAAGVYMFVVEASDAMFPAVKNRSTAIFPVDMYRVTDVTTTDVYGDSNARATISYLLSKAMNVQINIYNKDVVIPAYNQNAGTATYTASGTKNNLSYDTLKTIGGVSIDVTLNDGDSTSLTVTNSQPLTEGYTETQVKADGTYTYVWTVTPVIGVADKYNVKVDVSVVGNANKAWPPRVCNQKDDSALFDGTKGIKPSAAVDCIYVNDAAFVKSMYPATAAAALNTSSLNVRLQPIKTFDRSAMKSGDGLLIMEEWDALSFYNPKNCSSNTTSAKTDCKYETIPDGAYPFYVSARSDEPFDRYYYNELQDSGKTFVGGPYINGAPFKKDADVQHDDYLYATEKPVGKINITRGPVYFLDGSVAVYSNAPQLFNASTGPTFIPPYEIDFSVSRTATVEIAIVALQDGMCSKAATGYTLNSNVNAKDGFARDAVAGDICKFISTMTIANTGTFDANIIRKAYWDGTDHNGQYVKPGIYEVRLTARNYPDINLYQSTVKTVRVNANLFQVFDLLDADSYSISQRNTDMHIPYQISVPMKVALQIFKPGTTIYDYSKGTLRNPSTGAEVKDINEVLVRSIVGIRPSMTLIDEIWDGRDYAHQEVPDGTYPFRFVTAVDSSHIDTVTGEIVGIADGAEAIDYVADTYQYQTLHKATIAIGDGQFVCEDWEKTVFFYPNPFNDATKGTLEITKMPVPGTISIKYFNLAGDLVRDSDYTCIDANNYQVTMGSSLSFAPDNNVSSYRETTTQDGHTYLVNPNIRNAALRCKWDRTNQHGKKVARGVYFGLVDFKAQSGREHCQKVVKIIVP